MQEGIFYQQGAKPHRHFSMMFLHAPLGTSASQVGSILSRLWAMYQDLKAGRIVDLPGIDLPRVGQTFTIGYGPKAFALLGARRPLPENLGSAFQFRPPNPAGGGTTLLGSGLAYASGLARNPATVEVAVQVTAESPLAANRAIVETWKLLEDNPDPSTGVAALQLAAAYTGFNREDERSWIDFHDGTSNLRSGQERFDAIRVKPQGLPDDQWTEGGTYQAFLRLSVDLSSWRHLPAAAQELLVGRSKFTGCALENIDAAGQPTQVTGCPFAGTTDVIGEGNDDFKEPPANVPQIIKNSHVQRANHHIGPVEKDVSRRIFRQGYEFLDPPIPGRALSLGLNFVSFQDTPDRLVFILRTPGWLGRVNFGGDAQAQPPGMATLLSVHAAGFFLCPPEADAGFPGRSIFE